jgi:hypothetical protein
LAKVFIVPYQPDPPIRGRKRTVADRGLSTRSVIIVGQPKLNEKYQLSAPQRQLNVV